MARPRATKGIPAAITEIKDRLGVKKMAALVMRTGRRIYFWMEEGSDLVPSIRDCFTLDAAFIRAGGGRAPILEAYSAMLDAVADDVPRRPEDFAPTIAEASRECGEAIAWAIMSSQPATSIEDLRRTQKELGEGIAQLTLLLKHVNATIDTIEKASGE